MNKKSPSAVDVHVGTRVRAARLELRMSQQALADGLDLTFQQVQKYEKGANRIDPSRMVVIATILEKPVPWFFEGAPGVDGVSTVNVRDVGAELMAQTYGRDLALAFLAIDNREARHALLAIAKVMAK